MTVFTQIFDDVMWLVAGMTCCNFLFARISDGDYWSAFKISYYEAVTALVIMLLVRRRMGL